MEEKNIYWDIRNILSYNAFLNFIVGNRSAGKTYGCKKFVIDNFLKKCEKFIWLRRMDTELDDFKTTFFTDIKHEYPNNEFSYSSYTFYCDSKVMGYAIPLSTSLKKKSNSYEDVTIIIFDEFIINKNNQHYLKDEITIFKDLIETVVRLRNDFRCVILIANALTIYNPYFIEFNLSIPTNKKGIIYKDDILIQMINNEELKNAKRNTRFGKIIAGSDYADYSIDNKFLLDNNDFIRKSPTDMRIFMILKSGGTMYGVWISNKEGLIYVSSKYDPSCRYVFALLLEDHKPNMLLANSLSTNPMLKMFIDSYKSGIVFFDNQKTKSAIMEILRKTMR